MQYRKEIDGLRAVAVVPVILYHAGVSIFPGGFVGVDVFFVISGYLITTILLEDIEAGRFNFARFYERRIRRIFPALILVLLCCLPLAYFLMLPGQLKAFSASLIATVLSVSNFYFMFQLDYFNQKAELYPLLHTWSLGIEEQYYLSFPVILVLLRRLSERERFSVILALVLASWLGYEILRDLYQQQNFYFTPSRVWEIGVGSLCACVTPMKGRRESQILSALGLALVLCAILFFHPRLIVPGGHALFPVLGTGLIILFAGGRALAGRILQFRPVVLVGLISYSAYLWHQPLFAFARLSALREPSPIVMFALAGLTLVLAWLTWRFVETPFRRANSGCLSGQKAVFQFSSITAAVLIAVGGYSYATGGLPNRAGLASNMLHVEGRLVTNYGLDPICGDGNATDPRCKTEGTPETLLWGDSFAMHLVQGIVASDAEILLQQITISSCAPILDLVSFDARSKGKGVEQCREHNARGLDILKQNPEIETVILASSFGGILSGAVSTADGQITKAPSLDFIAQKVVETVELIRAQGAKVVLVSPTPSSGWDNGHCASRGLVRGLPEATCDFPLEDETRIFDLVRLVEAKGVPVYWLSRDICPDGICDVLRDGVFIYRDDGHLSHEGSAYLGRTYNWAERLHDLAR